MPSAYQQEMQQFMNVFDNSLFLFLTAGPDAPRPLVGIASFLASDIVPILALTMVVAWVRARPGWRGPLLDAVAAGLLGLSLVQVIGWLVYRPRPFELGLGANLLHHVPENSFPSDHATLMFAIAASLCLSPLRRAGFLLLPFAMMAGWARIYLGVHWPTDIFGGAVLGSACAWLILGLPSRQWFWHAVERSYELALRLFHLPSAIFPRRR